MLKNIGTGDRIFRLVIALVLLAYAFATHSWIALFLGIFTLYEVFASWCAFYELIGKNTCRVSAPINYQAVFATFLRYALAASFLSAVADRFGLWVSSSPQVAWGSMANFEQYTALLNPFIPAEWISLFAWMITALELVLSVFLLLGVFHKITAMITGFVFLAFALAMTEGVGIKIPLDYSVFTASAAAFLLSSVKPGYFSLSKE